MPVPVGGRGSPHPARADGPGGRIKIAVVVERYPVPTESFLINEVRALRDAGAQIEIIACSRREPAARTVSGEAALPARLARGGSFGRAPGSWLAGLLRSPRRSASALAVALAAAGPDPRRGRRALGALIQALRIHERVRGGGFVLLHAQFVNRPALVAALLSRLTGIPCTVSAHARDVFVPDFRLDPLVRAARLVVVCSTGAQRHLLTRLVPELHPRIRCLHHGLCLEQFTPRSEIPERRRHEPSSAASAPRRIQVLTVSRLVPKKGVDTVLRALAILGGRGWEVHLWLVGDGPLRPMLLRLARSLGVAVEHRPLATPEALHRWMCDADVLALGCTTARDGDRDGLPNVILEAMASGLPVVTTAGGSVVDAVEHAVTGLLSPPGDAAALARAVEEIATNEDLHRRIVSNARRTVESRFDLRKNVRHLLALLTEASSCACQPSA